MGLKRRNPARARFSILPTALAVLAVPPPVEAKTAPEREVERPRGRKISHEERHQMIAKVAYGRAERAGFATDPLVDWLEAEREIDAELGVAPS